MAPKTEFPAEDSWYSHFISYGETDAMGVLYHAEYLHLFERARSKFIRDTGLSYAETERRGIMLPVRQANCRYRVPVTFDEQVHVRVGVSKWNRASIEFVYELWNTDKTVLHATGMTEHACVNTEGKPIRIPEWLRERFE